MGFLQDGARGDRKGKGRPWWEEAKGLEEGKRRRGGRDLMSNSHHG